MKKYLATLALCLALAASAFAQFGGLPGFGGFPGFGLPGAGGAQEQDDGAKARKVGLEAAYGINYTPYFESAAYYMKLGASFGRVRLGACAAMFPRKYSYLDGSDNELGFSVACQLGYSFLRLGRLDLGASVLAGFYSVPFVERDDYSGYDTSLTYEDAFLLGGELECRFFVLTNLALGVAASYTTAGPMLNASVALVL